MSDQLIDPRLDAITDCLYRVSAKAVIMHDDKIFLTQETERWWSLPGGGIDHDEAVEATLKRELSEELRLTPESITVHEALIEAVIGKTHNGIPRIALLYRVEIPFKEIKTTDHVLNCGWFNIEEVTKMYISPTIGDTQAILRQIQVH